jgi:hypothetical protein
MAMARKTKAQTQQQDDDGDWRAELAKAKAAKDSDKADWRSGKEEGRPDDQKPDYGVQDHTRLLSPAPDPGPEDEGEEMKRRQSVPDGLNPEKDEEKLQERTRLDPDTGETLLPESVAAHQEQSLEAFRRARGEAIELREGEGFERSEETERLLTEQWRDNPAMLGVGRNIEEEPVLLVRAADAGPSGGVDLAKRFNDAPGGGPGEGAPPAIPAEKGQRHHVGAPWPGPLDPASSAPSPSPEPGPEPSQQWHEPQPVVFEDHEAAARGTYGPSAEQQREAQEKKLAEEGEAVERQRPFRGPEGETDDDPSRNSAGKIKHSFVADKMIETGLAAFGGDTPDHGTLQQALLYAQRRLRANWRQYMAQRQEKPVGEQVGDQVGEQQPAGA